MRAHAHAFMGSCTRNLKRKKLKKLIYKKAIDLFEIKKKRNNANFRARLLDCPATPSEILISRQ